ncbi:HAD family phosphatase [Clostridium tetanomorphum]|uniref:HAD family phosphatase n=2 Tax=Clostridium tetanomorphum TaxID=1553 RepID=A0A923E7B8_CLOTT|nr:HAD family phosphatase [Clostridium tetanomorphum]
MDVWEKIDIDFLNKRGLSVPNGYINEICARSFQKAAEYTIGLFGLDEKVEDIIIEWNNMAIHEYSCNVQLKPYAREYLLKLKSLGVKLAIATGLPRVLYTPALQNNNILQLFDTICSTDEVNYGKERPDVFLLAAERLGVSPKDCIVFEDVAPAIESSKKAGMKVYGIYDKYCEMYKTDIINIADGYLYDFCNAPIPEKR